MKLSICMMVKNEQKYLPLCLESLAKLRNSVESELIIVDTGSTDNTVEIAKKYTDKVYFHEWNNDFSAMRNITISYAKGEWILIIDGDEEIEDAKGMIEFLNSKEQDEYTAGIVNIRNVSAEGAGFEGNTATVPRLFKHADDFKFYGSIHEDPCRVGRGKGLGVNLIHYGYMTSDSDLQEKKFWRNITLLKNEVEKAPNDPKYRYYISVQYSSHGDNKEALEHALIGYEILKKSNENLRRFMFHYQQTVMCLIKAERFEEARKICIEGLGINDKYLDFYYFLAQALIALGEKDEAQKYWEEYLKLCEYYKKHGASWDGTFVCFYTLDKDETVYCNLAILAIQNKKYEKALEYIKKVKIETLEEQVLGVHIEVYLATEKYKELKKYFDEVVVQKDEEQVKSFVQQLEIRREKLIKQENLELSKIFSEGTGEYNKFNKIRLSYEQGDKQLQQMIDEFVREADLSYGIYADLIYYNLKLDKDIRGIISKLNDENMKNHLKYLQKNNGDFKYIVIDYLKKNKEKTEFIDIKINRMFQLFLLSTTLPESQVKQVLDDYIKSGRLYIERLYNMDIIENEMVYDVKDEQDAFLIYMYKAERLGEGREIEYIKYLRKALKVCPKMAKHIKLLLKEYTEKAEQQNKEKEKANSEFEQYKIQLKGIINNLIDTNQIGEAKLVIDEYKKIVKEDEEIDKMLAKINNK